MQGRNTASLAFSTRTYQALLMQGQAHAGSRVTATKRWWACTGCGHRFTTVGVVYPTHGRCPNQRCAAAFAWPCAKACKACSSSAGLAFPKPASSSAPHAAYAHHGALKLPTSSAAVWCVCCGAGEGVSPARPGWALPVPSRCPGLGNRFQGSGHGGLVGPNTPNPQILVPSRCPRPDSQFKAVAMGREGRAASADDGVADRVAFQPRGREHAFTLNSLAA